MNCEEAQGLMMKKVDGVLSAEEEGPLQSHLDSCAGCSAELTDFVDHKAATDLIRDRLQYDVALDQYWGGVYNRLEQRVGWSLVVIGVSICMAFGLVHTLISPDVPLWLRAGIGATGAGGLILLVSVIRWRLTTGRKDKYTEVIR